MRGHTSRDFVPWRFLDAGQLSLRTVSSLPASKNLHKNGLMHRSKESPIDHLVGAADDRKRHVDPKRFGGL
jgi:hypothetical protein